MDAKDMEVVFLVISAIGTAAFIFQSAMTLLEWRNAKTAAEKAILQGELSGDQTTFKVDRIDQIIGGLMVAVGAFLLASLFRTSAIVGGVYGVL